MTSHLGQITLPQYYPRMGPGRTTPIDHGQIARDHFGIDGTVIPLPGYQDSNARIESADGQRFVLRVSPRHPNIGRLRFVDEAMNATKRASFDVPSSVLTTAGELFGSLDGDRVVRLLTWVAGATAEEAGRPIGAAGSIGRTAAEMLRMLEPLRQSYERTFVLWDPGYSLPTITGYRKHVADGSRRDLIDRILSDVRSVPFDELPSQVIHSDLNAGNMVVAATTISGVIDFEDVAKSIRVGELSVACTYAMLTHDDPIPVAMAVIAGYRETASITEMEATHLFTLMLARMAVSVSVAASQPPGNPHQHHISAIMWDLLEKMFAEDTDAVAAQFKEAALS